MPNTINYICWNKIKKFPCLWRFYGPFPFIFRTNTTVKIWTNGLACGSHNLWQGYKIVILKLNWILCLMLFFATFYYCILVLRIYYCSRKFNFAFVVFDYNIMCSDFWVSRSNKIPLETKFCVLLNVNVNADKKYQMCQRYLIVSYKRFSRETKFLIFWSYIVLSYLIKTQDLKLDLWPFKNKDNQLFRQFRILEVDP